MPNMCVTACFLVFNQIRYEHSHQQRSTCFRKCFFGYIRLKRVKLPAAVAETNICSEQAVGCFFYFCGRYVDKNRQGAIRAIYCDDNVGRTVYKTKAE